MSDLIDRQAAIEALKAHEDYKGYLHGDFEEILEALPSAQPEPSQVARDIATIIENEQDMMVIERNAQQWIPCSERLPSRADHIDNMVLVCYGNGSVRFNTYMNGWVQGNPVAWMPLPEPYKGEQ